MQETGSGFEKTLGDRLRELGRTMFGDTWAGKLALRLRRYGPSDWAISGRSVARWFRETDTMPAWVVGATLKVFQEEAWSNAGHRAMSERRRVRLIHALDQVVGVVPDLPWATYTTSHRFLTSRPGERVSWTARTDDSARRPVEEVPVDSRSRDGASRPAVVGGRP